MANKRTTGQRIGAEKRVLEATLLRSPLAERETVLTSARTPRGRVLHTMLVSMEYARGERLNETALGKQVISRARDLYTKGKGFAVDYRQLQCNSPDAVGKLLMSLATEKGYIKAYMEGALREKGPGIIWSIDGELFERHILNDHTDLSVNKAMRSAAEAMRDEMMTENVRQLTNITGATVPVSGKFGPVKQATDTYLIMPDGNPKKFVDGLFLSEVRGEAKIVDLAEVEIKLPGAAGGLGPQIGVAQVRFEGASKIQFTIEGESQPRIVAIEDILLSPAGSQRHGITRSRTGAEKVRFSFTQKAGGYLESYLRIEVVEDVEWISRLTGTLPR